MAVIKHASREVICKIVYYGPGRSGKTTNIKYIYSKIPKSRKTELISLATKQDRTLFFDFLPIELGNFRGFKARLQVYTVPGQVYYDSTRKLVLQGADGIVFIADSQEDRLGDNLWSWDNLLENLKEFNVDINEIPIILEYNKRDLSNITPIEEFDNRLNHTGFPSFPATATKGMGVIKVFKAVGISVLKKVKRNLGV
ncbi:gliding-motility protein MglA [candidate division WOR-3 bacterium]|nr:gliding-motility protein MglA [candidate division WOR-3 bacterium]MCK4527946.1 gliding-motility protein MglA [candidate division WOR-3 bacterium]